MMDEQWTKDEFLALIEDGRTQFNALIAQIPQERMLEPGVDGDWAVKDILAHITSWERKMTDWLAQIAQGEEPTGWPQTNEEIDQLNAAFFAENAAKSLDTVLAEFEASFPQALAAAQAIPEEDLFDPERFSWRQGRPLAYMVGGNTRWHYTEHEPAIRVWLDK